MKPPLFTVTCLVLVWGASHALASDGPITRAPAGLTLYVSPQGNDAWSGGRAAPDVAKADGPLATLEGARNRIRDLKKAGPLPAGGVTVLVRGGEYFLAQPLVLRAEDSGTPQAPVVYRAYGSEKPVLVGGKPVRGFVVHKGAILKADLAAQGLKDVHFRQLFFDGRRQPLARYPNFDPKNPYGGGWAYADGTPIPMYKEIPDESKKQFTYKPQDARTWSKPEDAEVFVFARYNWWNNIVRIASIDREKRLVTLASDASYPIRPGDRYYVRNVFEELDAPGEWYLDRQTQTLYFWPPAPLEGKTVVAPTFRTILNITGAANVTVRGFTIECCEDTAVVLDNATDCLVAGCTIRNAGNYHGSGVDVHGGRRNGVVGCDIHEVGSHGVSLNGGDRITLTPAENYADNNYIHHTGVFYKQGVGVNLSGVGNRASHNLIHDGPRFGIQFSGNNLIIEFNHIRHVNLETADTGAVYTGGRDWISSRGTKIRYNYFHDILGYGLENGKWISPHYAWGVYLDDNTGGVDVVGNIVARCVRGLVHLHNGRDNLVENNILIDGTLQQIETNGWNEGNRMWTTHLPTMIKGYDSVAGQPAWREMRGMDLHPTKAVRPDGTIMSGNVIRTNILYFHDPKAKVFKFSRMSPAYNVCEGNLVYHFGLPLLTGQPQAKGTPAVDEWEAWKAQWKDTRSLVADPMFVNADKDDYRLKPGSPAFKLGFKPIAVEKIGPYADPLRASWPIIEAPGARETPLVSEK